MQLGTTPNGDPAERDRQRRADAEAAFDSGVNEEEAQQPPEERVPMPESGDQSGEEPPPAEQPTGE